MESNSRIHLENRERARECVRAKKGFNLPFCLHNDKRDFMVLPKECWKCSPYCPFLSQRERECFEWLINLHSSRYLCASFSHSCYFFALAIFVLLLACCALPVDSTYSLYEFTICVNLSFGIKDIHKKNQIYHSCFFFVAIAHWCQTISGTKS